MSTVSKTRFQLMLEARRAAGKYVCVGLDPDLKQIPDCVFSVDDAERVLTFLKGIVNATHHVAQAFKLQSAYYEVLGDGGPWVIRELIAYIREVDETIPIILDYKRGDIGRTNIPYAELAFDLYGADAVTIHPYLGMEAMEPFLAREDKLIIILCRTSNPGAGEFQDVTCVALLNRRNGKYYSTRAEMERELSGPVDITDFGSEEMPLYQFVAYRVAQSWNTNGNCALVVGATYADKELKKVRKIVGDDFILLLPGVGTQGASLKDSILNGKDSTGWAIVINNSSGILFAYAKLPGYTPDQWAEAARFAAEQQNAESAAIYFAGGLRGVV